MKKKPNVFKYHDYRVYLKDWIESRKSVDSKFSLRKLAQTAGLTPGYLSMVLSGERVLSGKSLAKILPELQLNKTERSFFEAMHLLGTSDSEEVRLEAFHRMSQFTAYSKSNQKESETYQYLNHWYHLAIRELTAHPEFKLDAEWIRSKLRIKISLSEINDAISFLVKGRFIEINTDGTITPPDRNIDCSGGVYRISLTQYHRQMFKLAEQSLHNTRDTERNIMGHTFSVSPDKYSQVKDVIHEAIQKIQEISDRKEPGTNTKKTAVYHIELALFPLTKTEEPQQTEETSS